ncbi:unnamed protein product [Chrysodeixis includens]|uniref:ZMYND8 protein n=1 Tax=Chrysodeixis includens TaxID=689277 RepID=A0A9P0FVD7_CHRIL|nr:unnamed protein product [Chrysodeixis includens]
MEESTEPHMETDVSSTTEDVPESQEVTGSDGNVEMFIVVEKTDEESDGNDESEKQPTQAEETSTNVPTPTEDAIPVVEEVNKSPVKSPTKDKVVKSPSKAVPDVVMIIESEPQKTNEVEPFVKIQLVEVADSSVKEPSTNANDDKPAPVQNSIEKVELKPVYNSPVKELKSQDSVKSSPVKELVIEKVPVNGKFQCNDSVKIDEGSNESLVIITPMEVTIDVESNDSQNDSLIDVSEKEHNKSISRELKSLINSAKESKIISECTQLTSKTRKSRAAVDTSSSSLNASLTEPNKISDGRRNSCNSQKSNCSEKSDKVTLKRSMRSQNPEFVSKVKQFLNSVTGKCKDEDYLLEDEPEEKVAVEPCRGTPPKIKKTDYVFGEKGNKLRLDSYCWRCHWPAEQATNEKMHPPMQCTVCPRSFHYKCLTTTERNKICPEKSWVCPECMTVLQAESSETRSPAMKKISLGMLCDLLKHALERMMDLNGVEPFLHAVDRTAFPDYDKYVVHPMDLSLMGDNIKDGLYGSTEAFIADVQWILHNSIIFNTLQSKLTAGARALVRSCRAEMGEIEACPECYAAAHARRPTWFTDVCTTPHVLLWAKLKGFPYWPAKGMSVNSTGLVDVRFFGAHDRAWVPAKDCFLYSEKDPNAFRTKRQDIIESMKEAEQHICNISKKFGKFVYPPFKTPFDPRELTAQLKLMIPAFEGDVRSLVKEKTSPAAVKEKSRSNSKSSKCSFNDGDISESEDTLITAARKMADGAEIAKLEEDDNNTDKDLMDLDNIIPHTKLKDESAASARKRRRSELEEAIITVIETSGSCANVTNEKRPRLDDSAEAKADEANKEVEEILQVIEIPKEDNETPGSTGDSAPTTDSEPSSNTEKEKIQRVTPIRIALVAKDRRHTRRSSLYKEPTAKIITPNKDEKLTPLRPKSSRAEKAEKSEKPHRSDKAEKSLTKSEKVEKLTSKTDKNDKTPNLKIEKVEKTPTEKSSREDRSRSEKRRNSRNNRSLNSSATRSSDKPSERRSERSIESNKEKNKDTTNQVKDKGEPDKSRVEKQMSPNPVAEAQSPKPVKERLQYDDDTTLAVIAREAGKSVATENHTGLPTITSVRSLSTTAQNTNTTIIKTSTAANTVEITLESSSESSIFTPTSTDNVTNMKDAVSKLQRLRNDAEPAKNQSVGRVGVRAFARMTSPEKQKKDDIQIEIKSEPIELDDADRHMEKMDLMNAFKLRPVNPPNPPNPPNLPNPPNQPSNLREVRINFNKVVLTSINPAANRKAPTKPPEVRPRAKKTFPQPKKPEEGRSELNSKNSMVYIPIQPPATQAPVRLPRPTHSAQITLRPPAPVSSAANNLVNTVTTPLMQAKISSPPTTTSASIPSTVANSVASVATVPTVHTVPLMTSVNGQWMFSFQPVMSVGAIENAPSPPILNGISERGGPLLALSPAGVGGAPPPGPLPAAPPAPLAAPLTAPLAPLVTPSALVTPVPVPNRPPPENNTPGEPPRLQQRPGAVLLNPLDVSTPIGSMPPPSSAGPLTAKLNQNAVKLTDFFRTLLEDSLEKLDEPAAQLTTLKLQLEQARWQHQQELDEVKHNHELTLAEMRASFEKERLRAVSEARRTTQAELEAAIRAAKTKQWCANCSQEAQFYCCWNTSYCDYPCQRAHWKQHFAVCQQRSQDSNNGEPPSSPENRLQPQPDLPVLQKNTCAPTLTVGGKLAPFRVSTQDRHSNNSKASIIVSMVEDPSGNQSMKCLGTYKPSPPTQMPPIIINKQIMNNEENANKKVVSSTGGYLIVGTGTNTPSRRAHTVQYYT